MSASSLEGRVAIVTGAGGGLGGGICSALASAGAAVAAVDVAYDKAERVAESVSRNGARCLHPDPEGYNRWVLDQQSIKRRGTPEDIGNLVAFLASDAASFITGQTVEIDGGWAMH